MRKVKAVGYAVAPEEMKLSKKRLIRQSAVVVLAGWLLALSAVAQQSTQQPSQAAAQLSGQQAAQETGSKTVATPGIPSTGFSGLDQYRASRIAMFVTDYGQLDRYRAANDELLKAAPVKDRVVFFGDSITDSWKLENYFPAKPYVNRGIGGQTTPQMLVRFRQDVIELKPKAVVILAGTNDIAGNTGPIRNEDIEANLATMADLAKAHGIPVVFASILPVHNYTPKSLDFFAQRPTKRILEVNRWLQDYCAKNAIVYLDYFLALVDEKGLLKRELADDGLHPNDAGYKIMAPLAEAAIIKAAAR
jgi:acyl-CoA thioesterase-1